MLEKEGKQAAQGLYHNLNTLESRPEQQPGPVYGNVAWAILCELINIRCGIIVLDYYRKW